MLAAPATIVMMLLVGLLIMVGGVLLGSAGAGQRRRRCPELTCRHPNPPAARFCGRCGTKLD